MIHRKATDLVKVVRVAALPAVPTVTVFPKQKSKFKKENQETELQTPHGQRRFRSWLSYLVVLHTGLVTPEQLLGQKEFQ